jgi:hypothetical protein
MKAGNDEILSKAGYIRYSSLKKPMIKAPSFLRFDLRCDRSEARLCKCRLQSST